jgi:L-rhamnose mutarotase
MCRNIKVLYNFDPPATEHEIRGAALQFVRKVSGFTKRTDQERTGVMKRYAFKMKLKPGCIAEYRRRHDNVWPELSALLKKSGISDFSIFFDEETNSLFAVQKQAGASSSQDLGSVDIVKRWWEHMSDIMDTNPDKSPVSIPLVEVYWME